MPAVQTGAPLGRAGAPRAATFRSLADAVVEFKHDQQRYLARIQSLKWAPARPEWLDLTQPAG